MNKHFSGTTMTNEYTYFAFISYNSADEKWAKWLHRHLEYFHIPSALCKEHPNLPKKIRPVFWYKQDLSATKLKKALEEALGASKYLIIICSPDSAKSDWVNDEVVTFIKQGKGDKIIPFIVAGIHPSRNTEDECFPVALRNLTRDEEIRGIDIHRKEGKIHALVDVIATMIGVRFDELWRRHERRRKQIRNIWITIVSMFLLCTMGIYDYHRTKVEYYVDIADSCGFAKGITQIKKDVQSHRNRTYKFEYKRTPFGLDNAYKWRIHCVSYINSSGIPQNYNNPELTDRFPIVEYHYGEDGKLLKTTNKDSYNQIISEYHYSYNGDNENCIIDIHAPYTQNTAFTSANSSSMSYQNQSLEKNSISRYILERDSNGLIVQKTFHSDNRPNHKLSRTCDFDGVSGYKYQYDSLGRITKTIFLDHNDSPTNNRYGYSQKEYYYQNNNLDSIVYKTKEGYLTKNERNWSVAVIDYDSYGNFILERYLDDQLMSCYRDGQFAQLRASYNERGDCIRYDFLSENGEIKINALVGFATVVVEYDDRGRLTSESYYVPNGWAITSHQLGVAKIRYKYDKTNRIIETSTYNVRDQLCEGYNSAAIVRTSYYENGLVKNHSFYNTNDEATMNNEGFHKIEYIYNKQGCLSNTMYYDKKSELADNIYGFSIINNTFNGQGNIIETEFLDKDKNPVRVDVILSAQCVRYQYDDWGRKTSKSLYDNDQRILGNQGWHKEEYEYGENGSIKKFTYYDTSDSVCITTSGFSSSEYQYNVLGRPVKIINYSFNDLLNIVEMEYNSRGQMTYWGLSDGYKQIEGTEGYSSVVYKYDALGNRTHAEFRDCNNRLCINNSLNYSMFEAEYNDYGALTFLAYYDQDKKLTQPGNTPAISVKKYEGNKLLEEIYYDKDGESLFMTTNGYARRVIEYGDNGQTLTDSFYNNKNELVVACLGFASCRFIYNKDGFQIGVEYYNERMEKIYSE